MLKVKKFVLKRKNCVKKKKYNLCKKKNFFGYLLISLDYDLLLMLLKKTWSIIESNCWMVWISLIIQFFTVSSSSSPSSSIFSFFYFSVVCKTKNRFQRRRRRRRDMYVYSNKKWIQHTQTYKTKKKKMDFANREVIFSSLP